MCLMHQYVQCVEVFKDNDLTWFFDVGIFPKHTHLKYGVFLNFQKKLFFNYFFKNPFFYLYFRLIDFIFIFGKPSIFILIPKGSTFFCENY